jgi:ABC-2 type transport system permease protein
MTTMILGRARPVRPGFGEALRAERIKLTSVRSTWWTLAALVVIGIGGTVLLCALNAEWLASPEANEAPGSFITGGIGFAQICAIVLGTLIVTGEYGTGMIRSTLAATPTRGRVMAAKLVVLTTVLFLVGTVTALIGYYAGNYFLDQEGVGLALEGDMARSIYGSGLFLAGSGLFAAGMGFILRHTAGTLTACVALMLVLTNLVLLVPGTIGDVLVDVMPSNAGSVISTPVPFNPELLGAWTGFGVFAAEIAALVVVAWLLLRRRDA